MDGCSLSVALRRMAVERGLCAEWTDAWRDDATVDDLLDKYVRGFDFTKGGEWPPLDFVREHFRAEDLERHGIYVDANVDGLVLSSGTYILLGSCHGSLSVSPFCVCDVYMCHDTDVLVSCGDFSKVWVTLHGDARADVVEGDMSFVRVRERRFS